MPGQSPAHSARLGRALCPRSQSAGPAAPGSLQRQSHRHQIQDCFDHTKCFILSEGSDPTPTPFKRADTLQCKRLSFICCAPEQSWVIPIAYMTRKPQWLNRIKSLEEWYQVLLHHTDFKNFDFLDFCICSVGVPKESTLLASQESPWTPASCQACFPGLPELLAPRTRLGVSSTGHVLNFPLFLERPRNVCSVFPQDVLESQSLEEMHGLDGKWQYKCKYLKKPLRRGFFLFEELFYRNDSTAKKIQQPENWNTGSASIWNVQDPGWCISI